MKVGESVGLHVSALSVVELIRAFRHRGWVGGRVGGGGVSRPLNQLGLRDGIPIFLARNVFNRNIRML